MSDAVHLVETGRRLPGVRRVAAQGAARVRLVRALRNLALRGSFWASSRQLTDDAGLSSDGACRLFGSVDQLRSHVATRHAVELVDALGLSPGARISLSPRDERVIAMAVLAGRRLEAGE